MTTQKRQAILVGVMVAMLAIAAAWSLKWMLQQREDARCASNDLAECEDMAAAIAQRRDKLAATTTVAAGTQELGKRIEAASRQAQLPATALEGVFPQSGQRVGNSPYVHRPTAIALRGLSLGQLATFLHALTDGPGLGVRDLRLRSPHNDVDRKLWDAEATVTCLVYAPPPRLQGDK
jgi:hypothetical protein